LNPERRQRGNGLHYQPLRRVVDVMRRGGWGTVTSLVQEITELPTAYSPASTLAAVDASAAAPGR